VLTLLQLDRRRFLQGLLCASTVLAAPACALADSAIGSALSPWREGNFDIHHIDTGRGNCTLLVFPDGTTMMIDAGAANVPPDTSSAAHPNASRRPGEWQARYALAHAPSKNLDYFLTTHIHPDHVGDVTPTSPLAPTGAYRLTGISDVDALLPIATVIDRSFPDYGAFPPYAAPFSTNYLAFLQSRKASVVRAQPGSDQQITLRRAPSRYPRFRARILAANAVVWTGQGSATSARLPDLSHEPSNAHGYENNLSIATRFEYGRFSYYAGGDLDCDTYDGRAPYLDIETPVVHVAGRTEVAAADHHGYFDACGPEFVRSLDAQVYVVQAWDIGHPGTAQMQRMTGEWVDGVTPASQKHDLFTTDLLPANELLNRRFAPQIKSKHGHVVVRVEPGGDSYHVYALDSTHENGTITGVFGPYTCRA
jgi:glyoxylase-like metal-dependent hydrolase (beta-lactamase superfamily II)